MRYVYLQKYIKIKIRTRKFWSKKDKVIEVGRKINAMKKRFLLLLLLLLSLSLCIFICIYKKNSLV